MRHPLGGVGGVQAGDVDQVGDDRTGGGFGACTFAVIQGGSYGVSLHHHSVHSAFDIGNKTFGRNQTRMNAKFNPLRAPLGNTEQFDPVAQLLGIFDVLTGKFGDAFDIGLVELHRNAEGNGRHDGCLVRCIHAFDVKCRVRFGIAQPLGFFQHNFEVQSFATHFRQDEVGCTVDDAGNPVDSVSRQALTERFDDGNTTGNRRLKRHHHALG